MDIDTRCPVCWRLDEDGGHCFLKCKYVKECWWALNLEEERIMLTGLSSATQVSAHVLSLSEEKKLLVVGLLWSWWDARNKANAGEPRRTTEEVIYRARVVTQQLSNATTAEDMQMVRTCAPRWTPPPPDIWKINVDAACWAKEMDGAWGFVIRDHQGSAVLAGLVGLKWCVMLFVLSPMLASKHFRSQQTMVCSVLSWRLILRPW